MADQPQTDRSWKDEAAAWRARAEHLQATVDRLRSLAVAGEAAGFLAHELNNVFTPVVGYCHVAQAPGADDAVKAKAIAKALAAAERVGEVSSAILGLAGSVGGERKDAEGGADVRSCAKAGLLVLGAERWGREGIEVRIDVPRGTLVKAPAGVVQQVVMNLALNARRAMAGRRGRLEVVAREVGGVVRMEVRDEGEGMNREVMGRALGITSSDDVERRDQRVVEGQYQVDVQELARSGSINGQARWGVRLREMTKEQMTKGPKGEGPEKNIARLRGAKIDASMSPIKVWDAGEVAEELREKGSRDRGVKGSGRSGGDGAKGVSEAGGPLPDGRGSDQGRGRSADARSGCGAFGVGPTVGGTGNGDTRAAVGGMMLRGSEGDASVGGSSGTNADPLAYAPSRGSSGKVNADRLAHARDSSGTGLGLALCLELVGRVGGRITARSEVGVGTVVIVEWPAVVHAKRAA